MALVKLGGLAQDVRGSLNGSVFSRNRGGAYVRSKVSPVQPYSEWSSKSREMFKATAQRWSHDLDDGQRQAWNDFAAVHPFLNVFGDSIILSGIAMFESVNRRVLEVGEPYIDDIPDTFVVEGLGLVELAAAAAGGVLTNYAVTCSRVLVYTEGLYVFGTKPLLGARKVQKNELRLQNNQDTGLWASAADASADVMARFPDTSWVTGQRISALVAALNPATGAISNAVAVQAVIA